MESPSAASSSSSSPQTPTPKRQKRGPSVKCPLCHEVVPPNQYRQHFQHELHQLDNPDGKARGKRGAAIAATKQITRGKHSTTGPDGERRALLNEIQKRRIARHKDDHHSAQGSRDSGGTGRSSGGDRGGRRLIDELDPERGGTNGQATCFICDERLFGSLEDINAHIDRCLSHPPTSSNNNTNNNNNTNTSTTSSQAQSSQSQSRHHEPFEEYEWAGQTRVRATALFEGGLANLPGGSTSRLNSTAQTDVDDELNIEDDDEEEYGSAQFTERDVLLQNADAESEELREIVIGSSSPTSSLSRAPSVGPDKKGEEKSGTGDHVGDMDVQDASDQARSLSRPNLLLDKHKRKRNEMEIDLEGDGDEEAMAEDDDDDEVDQDDPNEDEEIDIEEEDDEDIDSNDIDAMLSSAFASGDTKLVIEALKGKIRHLEAMNKDVPMCLICLEPYKVPLTSIVCWHVHCETCWFQTLGTKKLCPQCQKITLPKDLRRVYL